MMENSKAVLRFDYASNTTSCHTPFKMDNFQSKPRGFDSVVNEAPATHQRGFNSKKYNPFDLKNTKDLTAELCPSISDPDNPSKPLIRVITNKFPALSAPLSQATLQCLHHKTCATMDACGFQEVIIQHWLWNKCQALLTQEQMELLWASLAERSRVNANKLNVKYVQVMENHGPRSGASLPHPHSQILALPFVPFDQQNRLDIAKNWYTKTNECLFTHLIHGARTDGRVVIETEHTIAFIPFAINRSYETWIVSKTSPTMECEKYMNEMSNTIRKVLLALYHLQNDPDYNSIVRQAPVSSITMNGQTTLPKDWYRWHVVVTPHGKTGRWAGIKGYGDFVPISGTPEEQTLQLKECLRYPCPESTSTQVNKSRTILLALVVFFGVSWCIKK